MENLEFINVCEDGYDLYEYEKAQGWYTGSYDDFEEDGENLRFFEGDPDMLKIDGEVGYFALCGNKVFYYVDSFDDDKARGILRDFFKSGRVCNFGYYSKFCHGKKCLEPNGTYMWDRWDMLKNGIAYRGGAGYFYDIIPLRAAA